MSDTNQQTDAQQQDSEEVNFTAEQQDHLNGVEKEQALEAAKKASDVTAIIQKHVLLSAASGVIPVCFVDTAALVAVQYNMLREIAGVYGQSVTKELVSPVIGILAAAVTPGAISGGLLGSTLLRQSFYSIPVIGWTARVLVQPGFNAAFTYALGKTFDVHYASGGTALNFNVEDLRQFFVSKFREKAGAAPAAA